MAILVCRGATVTGALILGSVLIVAILVCIGTTMTGGSYISNDRGYLTVEYQ